jgi:hypothetical protein
MSRPGSRESTDRQGFGRMAQRNSQLDPCVIVVGDPHCEAAREMVQLAREYQVRAVPCADVYGAAAQMATVGPRALLAGRIQDLTRGNGILLAFAAARGIRCCCLIERQARPGSACLRAALRAGASLIFETREARAVLADWLAAAADPAGRALRQEDMAATEAELGALLGQPGEA